MQSYARTFEDWFMIEVPEGEFYDQMIAVVTKAGCSYASTSEPGPGRRSVYLSEAANEALAREIPGFPKLSRMPRLWGMDLTYQQHEAAERALEAWAHDRNTQNPTPTPHVGVMAIIDAISKARS